MRPDLKPKNFFIVIEYDGSAYHGWQRQKQEATIQAALEKSISTMTGRKVTITGSGRTDAGVHARGQTANFRCETRLTAPVLLRGLNSLLPEDIVIRTCREVPYDFHARYDAIGKTYQYHILNRNLPAAIGRQYAWHIRAPLHLEHMQAAVVHILGAHDFKAFEATGSPRSHTDRIVFSAAIEARQPGRLVFTIQANGFLRYMVRNLVGTFVEIGLSRKDPADIPRILASRDRKNAGATAPPHGLFLMSVDYPEQATEA